MQLRKAARWLIASQVIGLCATAPGGLPRHQESATPNETEARP